MKLFPDRLYTYWDQLYPGFGYDKLDEFVSEVKQFKNNIDLSPLPESWYKEVVVYSLYVDLFAGDFAGLTERLPYLKSLGVSCLWLLPILDSPMKDAGFDIRDYRKIREDLLSGDKNLVGDENQAVFQTFLQAAHGMGIRVIFDIAINHVSDEHPWFLEAKTSKDNKYRDYFIWSDNQDKYKDARIIFYGLCESNWEKSGDQYFFHRFFEFQPDLNYRNPDVLFEMTRNFLFWLEKGVDGFRADAIPYLWKEEGTSCENLPETHTVVKFFRAVIEYVQPGTLLLAEACQKPNEVVKYFGDGDECNAGYHFPLMPQIFKAVSMGNGNPVKYTLNPSVTPSIPDNAQWFTFLRCHDELSLELVYVSEDDRKYIHDSYCKKPEWDFRKGQGVSARLAELMDRDPDKIALIYSVMLTLPGTPVVYYGDEFGKLNDQEYYQKMIKITGKDDTRFLVRGEIDWDFLEGELKNQDSLSSLVFNSISKQIKTRNNFACFGKGSIEWLQAIDKNGNENEDILLYLRNFEQEKVLVFNNLSNKECTIRTPEALPKSGVDLLGNQLRLNGKFLTLEGLQYHWIDVS